MNFSSIDLLVFIIYCVIIVGAGLWVSRTKKGEEKTSEDYFLAGKALPWWAIGTSLIASNISAEQFIGMSGAGFAVGLGISSYEWMAAITLIIVGKYFLPIFLEKKIYTMPQFLETRYDNRVRTSLAVFWLAVYVLVNLTSVLYLGSLALETIMGIDRLYAIYGLACIAIIYSIYGGLTAVAWTDVIQVVFLVAGGLMTTYLALDAVSGGEGMISGFKIIGGEASQKFDMIIEEGIMIPDGKGGMMEAYDILPGISVLIGGMWIANIYYWGLNQYITQRALAAKDIAEAQRGVLFAGFLKLLMPLIVVIPGIAAYVLMTKEGVAGMPALTIDPDQFNALGDQSITKAMTDTSSMVVKSDKAYPALLGFLPIGFKGAAFAALVAAIISSLASMANSTATIFTLDLYKPFMNKNASERQLVNVGRITGFVAFFIAALVAPALGKLDQAFQFIQDFTGFVSPGVVAIFMLGFFWRKATPNAALLGSIATIVFSFILYQFTTTPFMDRVGIVFLLVVVLMIIVSLLENKGKDHEKGIPLTKELFKTGPAFNIGTVAISIILTVFYLLWW